VESVARDWRRAPLDSADRALADFADRLTRAPASMGEHDVAALRRAGFDDVAVHDATQVVGYFNYINRVASALGVELEQFVRPWGGHGAPAPGA